MSTLDITRRWCHRVGEMPLTAPANYNVESITGSLGGHRKWRNPLQRSDAIASDPIPVDATADEKLTVAAARIERVSIVRQSEKTKIAAALRLAVTLATGDTMNFVRLALRPFLWTNSTTLPVPPKRFVTSSRDAFCILAIKCTRWTLETA